MKRSPLPKVLVALFAAMVLTSAPTRAADWPTKPIRWVVPYAPGGPTDTVSRLIAQHLADRIGQPVIVDNRPGAVGNIGTLAVGASPADGHTLLYVVPAIVLNPLFMKSSPDRSIVTPVTRIIQYPMVLLASNNFKPRSIEELVALARSKPGSVSCASTGGIPTIACEMLKASSKADIVIVNYKGQAQATTALMSGEIDLMFDGINSALPAVKAGRYRALAALDAMGKSSALGQLPELSELFPGFEFTTWHGLMAPAGTPKDVVQRINQHVAAVLSKPEVKARLIELGFQGVGDAPEDFERFLRSESAKFERVVRQAGIKPE